MTRASPSYRPLFRKYAAYCAGLVTVALLASGALSLYSGYQELRALLDEVQREKARGAAFRIEQFARVIEAQLRGALLVEAAGIEQSAEERHLELIRVMRQAPAISDLAWIDAAGVQQVKVSRTARDQIGPPAGSNAEFLAHPAVLGARTGKLHVGPVTLRSESEPYSMFAIAGQGPNDQRGLREGSALLADVNLKLVWDIVSAIQVGEIGRAHV